MISDLRGKPRIIGLIIAAGLSNRMGKFKPLLEWNGKTFLSNVIVKLKSVCNEIIIITGNESEIIEKYVYENYRSDNILISCEYNNNYLEGMFTSLKKGIEVCKEVDWILYHQIDQPNVPNKYYKEFLNQIDKQYDWIQPRLNKKNGHPILLGKKILQIILHAANNTNLRILSNNSDIKKKYWDCDYPEIFTDIDTVEDLYKLKRERNV